MPSIDRRTLLQLAGRLAALAGGAGLVGACQAWPRPPTVAYRAAPASPVPRPATIVVGLPSDPPIERLPLLHLAGSGLLEEHGLDVRLVWGQGGNDTLPALLAGKIQVGVLDVVTAALAAERRVDLAGFFQLYGTDPSTVFVLERSGIRGAAMLEGQRIGVTGLRSTAVQALAATLRSASLKPGAVELVSGGGGLTQLLESGQVSALAASGHLIPWLEARSLPVVRLPRAGWEIVPGPLMVTTRAHVAENRAAVSGLAAALRRGVLAILADPDGFRATALATFSPDPQARSAVLAQVDSVYAALAEVRLDKGPGWADPARYDATRTFLSELGATGGSADLTQVFINDFLPRTP